MIKIDLHTHSVASHDGGLSEEDYWKLLATGELDVIAVTDHGTIEFAQYLCSLPRFQNAIIVGQEVASNQGEIIGLYLNQRIPDGLNAEATVREIKRQNGLVIVPHPLETLRKGLSESMIEQLAQSIDAIELYNGRAIKRPKHTDRLMFWARSNSIPLIASSDAHSLSGIGRTFTTVASFPGGDETLRLALQEPFTTTYEPPPLSAYLAPKLNRLIKKVLS